MKGFSVRARSKWKSISFWALILLLTCALLFSASPIAASPPPTEPPNPDNAQVSKLEQVFNKMSNLLGSILSAVNPLDKAPQPANPENAQTESEVGVAGEDSFTMMASLASSTVLSTSPVAASSPDEPANPVGAAPAEEGQADPPTTGNSTMEATKYPGRYLSGTTFSMTPIVYPAAYPISREHYSPYGAYFVPQTEYNLEAYQDFYATWSYPNYPYYVSNYTAPYYPYYYRGSPAYYPYYASYPYYTGYPSTGYSYYGYPYTGYPYYDYGYPYSEYPYYVGYPSYTGYGYTGYPYAGYDYYGGYPYTSLRYTGGPYYYYQYGGSAYTGAQSYGTGSASGLVYYQDKLGNWLPVPIKAAAPAAAPAVAAPAAAPTPSYPGLYYSDYFYLKAGEVVDIVVDSTKAPVNTGVAGCEEFPGGINLFITGLITPGAEQEELNGWITSCDFQRTDSGWEAHIVFSAKQDGRYQLFFVNKSGESCDVAYDITLRE
jgi:hypothetical protein